MTEALEIADKQPEVVHDAVMDYQLITHAETVAYRPLMVNSLESVVIKNKRRGGWHYRFRDLVLVTVTLGLWVMVFSQVYFQLVRSDGWVNSEFIVGLLEILGINFVVVFSLMHCWVLYERLLHFFRKRRRNRHNALDQG